jgi:hypothetical protein
MSNHNKNLENNLRGSANDPLDDYLSRAEKGTPEKIREKESQGGSPGKTFIKVAVIVLIGMFLLRGLSNFSFNPVSSVITSVTNTGPSEDLLNRMGARMTEMGYGVLTHDELRELRRQGVTATYISNVRALGFEDLTLDDAVRLAQANVTSAFMAMMLELGYEPTIDDYITLRRAGITAHYTSNVHDLGYRDVTFEQLIRMQRIGVSTSLIERLQQERGPEVPLEDIIRYRISNQ